MATYHCTLRGVGLANDTDCPHVWHVNWIHVPRRTQLAKNPSNIPICSGKSKGLALIGTQCGTARELAAVTYPCGRSLQPERGCGSSGGQRLSRTPRPDGRPTCCDRPGSPPAAFLSGRWWER